MKPISLCFCILLADCASTSQDTTTVHPTTGGPYLDCAAMADALERRGRHLEASYYWEAALRNGGEEEGILPRLFVTQVRSGRLRAAKFTIHRLLELHPENRELHAFQNLLARYAPPPDLQSPEVSP